MATKKALKKIIKNRALFVAEMDNRLSRSYENYKRVQAELGSMKKMFCERKRMYELLESELRDIERVSEEKNVVISYLERKIDEYR